KATALNVEHGQVCGAHDLYIERTCVAIDGRCDVTDVSTLRHGKHHSGPRTTREGCRRAIGELRRCNCRMSAGTEETAPTLKAPRTFSRSSEVTVCSAGASVVVVATLGVQLSAPAHDAAPVVTAVAGAVDRVRRERRVRAVGQHVSPVARA